MRETWVRSLSGGDSPEGGHGNPLQYSCLENPMDRGAWRATVHRVQRVGQEGSNIARTHADNHTEWTQSGVTFQHYEQRRWLLNVINGHRRVCSAQSNVEDQFFHVLFPPTELLNIPPLNQIFIPRKTLLLILYLPMNLLYEQAAFPWGH